MSRLPAFFRQGGRIKPPASHHEVRTAAHAIDYFASVGSTVSGEPGNWILNHRGWSHGGVNAGGMVHIANEDIRLYRKDAPPE